MQFANLLSVIFSEPYVYRHPSSFLFDLISKHAKELSIESRHECEAWSRKLIATGLLYVMNNTGMLKYWKKIIFPFSHVLWLATHAYIPKMGKAKCMQNGDNNAWMVLNIAKAIPTYFIIPKKKKNTHVNNWWAVIYIVGGKEWLWEKTEINYAYYNLHRSYVLAALSWRTGWNKNWTF